jgi:hypothetical protein
MNTIEIVQPDSTISLEIGLGVPLKAGALLGAYGSFYDTTNQTLVSANVEKKINIGATLESNAVSIVDGTKITFERKGVYNIQYSVQFVNSSNSVHVANIWLSKNNQVVADSNRKFSVPSKQGQINGHLIVAVNYIMTLEEDDYLEFKWTAENTAVSIETIAASGTIPRTTGIILTAQQVMYLSA